MLIYNALSKNVWCLAGQGLKYQSAKYTRGPKHENLVKNINRLWIVVKTREKQWKLFEKMETSNGTLGDAYYYDQNKAT